MRRHNGWVNWSAMGVAIFAAVWMASNSMAAEPAADPLRPPAITAENVPAIPTELAERLRQYQAVRSAAFRGWSPDGDGMLIATRFGDTAQVHRVYSPGGRREQITFFNEPCDGVFVPATKDGSLLLSMGRGGDENFQLYRLDRASGRSILLTDGKSRNESGPVSDDGSRMAYRSNRRNGADTDIFLADPRDPAGTVCLLETKSEYWAPVDWSPDGTRLVINRTVSATETYPAIIAATPGSKPEMIPIPNGGPATYGSLQFSPDGKSLYVTTNANAEFEQLAKIDLASMAYTWLTEDIPWSVDGLDVHPESGDVAFTVNEDGSSSLYVIRGGKRQKLETPLGVISGIEFSPDGKHIGFTLGLSNLPADAYSISLSDGKLARWTFSEVGGLNPQSFQPAKLVRYKSFDGREIPAFYYKPTGATAEKPAPVIINIHGGPEAQYRPTFAGNEQFYLNELGVAVIHPNVRGSDGYGKTYLKLDNAADRENSVRDIGGLLDWIAQQPELDKSRVCVIGGSYGGYMVLASLVHFGDRLKAGVDIVGIASFLTFLKNTAAYRRDLRRVEYGDERDPKMLEVFARIDPLNNAEKIRSALMVVHGRNDPRVPFSEAEQIAAKVRSQGKTVWTVYADNEGHGFAKKANRDYYIAAVVLFLQENVLK